MGNEAQRSRGTCSRPHSQGRSQDRNPNFRFLFPFCHRVPSNRKIKNNLCVKQSCWGLSGTSTLSVGVSSPHCTSWGMAESTSHCPFYLSVLPLPRSWGLGWRRGRAFQLSKWLRRNEERLPRSGEMGTGGHPGLPILQILQIQIYGWTIFSSTLLRTLFPFPGPLSWLSLFWGPWIVSQHTPIFSRASPVACLAGALTAWPQMLLSLWSSCH